MLFHDNPKEKLVWLEDELLDDELEEILYGGEDGAMQPFSTLGFYFFVKVAGGKNTIPYAGDYPFVSAAGILFTAIVAPVTLLTKHLLEKYGPSEE